MMNINRNNYENFFLLYVDGEMSPQEMLEVDGFCQKHPDLAEELQLLMDTCLSPEDEMSFTGKEGLLKAELWDEEALTPLQQALLMQLDGEAQDNELAQSITQNTDTQKEWKLLLNTRLNAAAVSMPHKHQLIKALEWDAENLTQVQLQLLEAFEAGSPIPAAVLADVEAQKDWMLLQQCRLEQEVMEMPGKEKLYRRETAAPKAPVVPMGWWRYAAAAAIVVGIGVTIFTKLAPEAPTTEPGQMAINQPVAEPQEETLPTTQPEANKAVEVNELPKTKAPEMAMLAQTAAVRKTDANKTMVKEPLVKQSSIQQPDTRSQEITAFRLSQTEEISLRNPKKNVPNLEEQSRAPIRARDYQPAANNAAILAATNNNQQVQYSNAVQMESDTEDEYVTIGGIKVKSQKLRGVIRTVSRKVSRTFDKSTVAPANENNAAMR